VSPGRVVAVVGPTATGKSDLAVALAQELDAEVVNADSMQLYRGMDIGTAKLSAEQRDGVPHHLLDVWDVTHPASVVEYRDLALAAVEDVTSRGRTALLVGGSGLYVNAVLDDWQFPGTDPLLRAQLEQRLDDEGAQALHDELAERDPEAAARILPTNGRRIVRALEVVGLQGSFTASLPQPGAGLADTVIGLDLERDVLDERIEQRVDTMWRAGWVQEVRELEAHGLRSGRTASRALGYQQILAMLDGTITDADARSSTVTGTRRFARRQQGWFRRDPRIQWLAADDHQLVSTALQVLDRPDEQPAHPARHATGAGVSTRPNG
jgi:tRNA dimethylallyltransferase